MPRATVIGSGLPASDPLSRGVYANATLTAITGPGAPDEAGDPAPGADLWTGEATGYLTRVRQLVSSDSSQQAVRLAMPHEQFMALVDVFWLPRTAAAPILEVAGPDWEATTVTITDRRTTTPVTLTARVNAMENRAVGTMLDHLRLELEDLALAS